MLKRLIPSALIAPGILALGLLPSPARADAPFTIAPIKVSARVGAATTAHVSVKPSSGFHINKDYPTSLKVTAPDGVAVPKPALGKADGQVSEQEAAFDVVLTPSVAGARTIAGELKFAVCSATTCDPHREKFTILVDSK